MPRPIVTMLSCLHLSLGTHRVDFQVPLEGLITALQKQAAAAR